MLNQYASISVRDVEVNMEANQKIKFMAYTESFVHNYDAFSRAKGGPFCGAVFWRTILSLWGLIFFSISIKYGGVPK